MHDSAVSVNDDILGQERQSKLCMPAPTAAIWVMDRTLLAFELPARVSVGQDEL